MKNKFLLNLYDVKVLVLKEYFYIVEDLENCIRYNNKAWRDLLTKYFEIIANLSTFSQSGLQFDVLNTAKF